LEVDKGKKEVLDRCVKSLTPECDEIIVVKSKGRSLAKCINVGCNKAKGDFLIVSNDDITMRSGHLKDLCHKGEVHSPINHGGIRKTFHAHLWCMPKEIYKQIGGQDETCPGPYYIDSDYWVRLIKEGIPVVLNDSVHINHPEPARTLGKIYTNQDKTREWFLKKHGKGYLNLIE